MRTSKAPFSDRAHTLRAASGRRAAAALAVAALAAALLGLGVAASAAPARRSTPAARKAAPGTCILAGKVVNSATGKPLAKVGVRFCVVAGESHTHAAATTGTDGSFKVSVARGARVRASWSAPGSAAASVDLGALKGDRRGLVLRTSARQAAGLRGRVLLPDGTPAAWATVQSGGYGVRTQCDANGRFALTVPRSSLPHDRTLLVLSRDRKAGKLVTVKPGATTVEATVEPTCDVEGRALADDNRPAAGLEFRLYPMLNSQPAYGAQASYRTGAEGKFTVKGALPGTTYSAMWYASGGMNQDYQGGQATITVSAGEPLVLRGVRRFADTWQAPGNIGVHPETRCARLTNYCLDANDNLLACDGASKVVRVISPEDRLIATWKLPFSPEAIRCRGDGTVVVAGGGGYPPAAGTPSIALLGPSGQVLKQAPLPGRQVSAVACSGKDVFVAVRETAAYAIYRLSADLTGPVKIVDGLRGCCGQMDFAARDGVLYVAANCLFKVVKYDRNGKELGRFGERKSRQNPSGFDGCCEPKNVCLDERGNLYTADSGRCNVKKFTAGGKFLGAMGDLEGIRGCVRVTVAVPRDGSRIYVLDTGRNIIRALTPPRATLTAQKR